MRADLGRRVAARYGIRKVYSNHEEIAADPEIEAVGVSAPYALQGRIAEDLVRAGKHVFMEKPMAVSVARARSLVAAESPGARVCVAYMKRYDPGNLLMKRRLDAWRQSGEAGPILYARAHGFAGDWRHAADPNVPVESSVQPAPASPEECPEWLPERWRGAYLGYLQQWTHNVNLLRFFLAEGGRPAPVQVRSVDLDADGMTGVAVLQVQGTRCVLESAYSGFHAWDEHTQVYFRDGWLRSEAPPLMQKNAAATVEQYRAAAGDRPAQLVREYADPRWSYREEAVEFLRRVRSGEPFPSSAEDTLHDVQAFEDVYRAWLAAGR